MKGDWGYAHVLINVDFLSRGADEATCDVLELLLFGSRCLDQSLLVGLIYLGGFGAGEEQTRLAGLEGSAHSCCSLVSISIVVVVNNSVFRRFIVSRSCRYWCLVRFPPLRRSEERYLIHCIGLSCRRSDN